MSTHDRDASARQAARYPAAAPSARRTFAGDIALDLRQRIIAALQASYDRFEPACFERGPDGHYPPLGEGRTQRTLDWIYPAVHLTLEPRPGREAADRDLARKMILRAIRQGQYRKPADPADGIWHWWFTDQTPAAFGPGDRNTSGFMGVGLMRVWDLDARRLSDWPAEDFAEFKEAVRASIDAAERLPVRIGYTNPQILDFYLAWSAADLLVDGSIRDRMRRRLEEFLLYAATTDTFEEYLSPTYMAVNLSAATLLAHYVKGTPDEPLATELLERIWRQIGAAAHGPTREVCGPHARAYGDRAIEKADNLYAWLHLAAPDVYTIPGSLLSNATTMPLITLNVTMYDGLAAPGLYVPLGVPADAMRQLRDRFETPVESRELLEWIGRCAWWPPYDLSRPDPSQPAPRFRIATRYRTSRFCLGSVNEQDGWLQRRSVLVYWLDAAGEATGLKWQVVVEVDGATRDDLGDWLFMESIELISLQSRNQVIGAYRTAPVVEARPGEALACPARVFGPGRADAFVPRDPVGWFLGTHWRQPIERAWRHQRGKRLWVGVTPIGAGRWEPLDEAGTHWAFAENGIEAVIETPRGASLVMRANRTSSPEPVECLQFYEGTDLPWDWLNPPAIFAPFSLLVQEQGARRRCGLTASGDAEACELRQGDLRLEWRSPTRPDRICDRTWRAFIAAEEVLPAGYAR